MMYVSVLYYASITLFIKESRSELCYMIASLIARICTRHYKLSVIQKAVVTLNVKLENLFRLHKLICLLGLKYTYLNTMS